MSGRILICDLAPPVRVAREIDLAHPARPERVRDLMDAESRSGRQHIAILARVEGPAPSASTIS
jgi:hypothetical protein